MIDNALHYRPLTEIAAMIRARTVSPLELTEAMLRRIEQIDPTLHSYATLTAERALEQARLAEDEIVKGRYRGPLHGVPIAVKDLCFTKGSPTGCGTTILADWRPEIDATVVTRLRTAGAVLLGKLQMTEGAFADHHPNVTRPLNPWHPDHWAGASSSGSGVATAAGLCFASLGSDTGGSIRFPCATNGITGLKPTWGRVSRHGVFPLSDSLDHIGPMTRCAADAAAMLGAIAGRDDHDPTTLPDPVPDYLAGLGEGVLGARGLRIGIDPSFNTGGVDGDIAKMVEAAAGILGQIGAELCEIAMPDVRPVVEGWTPMCAAEAAVAHAATFPARADEYGPTLRRFLEGGHAVGVVELAGHYIARDRFKGELLRRFLDVDLILAPAMTNCPSFERMTGLSDHEEIVQLLRFTAPFDTSGSPTITLPCGFNAKGLPVGFQLVGPHLSEGTLLRAGHAYQQATPWHTMRPPV